MTAEVHVAFPLRLDSRGRVAVAPHERWVAGLVEQVLFTRPGERVNRPSFGAGLAQLVFTPLDDGIADATRALVAGALQRELGDLLRIETVDVTVVDTTIHVDLVYQLLTAPQGERSVVRVSGGTP